MFLAKWISHSFDRMILRMKGAGERPSCPLIFWLLKKATSTFIFLRMFILVKDIRNLQNSLRNKLLYPHFIITYMGGGYTPSSVPRSLH